MSNVDQPTNSATNSEPHSKLTDMPPSSEDKGKGRPDAEMEEDDDDDDEEEEYDDDEDEDEDMEEDALDEINPDVIQPRRTRGLKVDYTSSEAMEKAGLKKSEVDGDGEEEEDFVAKE